MIIPGRQVNGGAMDKLELKFSASLKNARLGTVAAAQISKAFYHLIKAEHSGSSNKECVPESDQFAADVEISVGEACTNSVKHCSHPEREDNDIIVTFSIESEADSKHKLTITVKDQNDEFDFDGIAEPNFNEFPESGYGIFIIKEKMKNVTYSHDGGWNILTMTKYI